MDGKSYVIHIQTRTQAYEQSKREAAAADTRHETDKIERKRLS